MKKYTWNEIIEKRMSKGELFENLNVTFDYTLPQEWLNDFVDKTGLDYEMVRFSTVWIYPENEPFSLCKDVCKYLKSGTYCARKFNNVEIEIDYQGRISVTSDWSTNWGYIYPHMINEFKQDIVNPITGFIVQVIGMDSELSKTHSAWIYSKIKKGYFDHLITD